jgi:crotonobetainyl-CoA:carnitine CoA-transferase CaiB-like acyl-CoA transferase
MRILKEEGCIYTPFQTPLEVSNDPQAFANNYFIEVQHPQWGKIKMTGFPWDFNDTPALWRCEAPAFGKHTEEILLALDYSQDDVACLKTEGVVE